MFTVAVVPDRTQLQKQPVANLNAPESNERGRFNGESRGTPLAICAPQTPLKTRGWVWGSGAFRASGPTVSSRPALA